MDQEIKKAIQDSMASVGRLVEDVARSLQNEIRELRAEMHDGFDRLDAATRRHSSMLVGGTMAIGGLNRWTRRQDKLNINRDAEMKQLRERVRKLEQQMRRKKAS